MVIGSDESRMVMAAPSLVLVSTRQSASKPDSLMLVEMEVKDEPRKSPVAVAFNQWTPEVHGRTAEGVPSTVVPSVVTPIRTVPLVFTMSAHARSGAWPWAINQCADAGRHVGTHTFMRISRFETPTVNAASSETEAAAAAVAIRAVLRRPAVADPAAMRAAPASPVRPGEAVTTPGPRGRSPFDF